MYFNNNCFFNFKLNTCTVRKCAFTFYFASFYAPWRVVYDDKAMTFQCRQLCWIVDARGNRVTTVGIYVTQITRDTTGEFYRYQYYNQIVRERERKKNKLF